MKKQRVVLVTGASSGIGKAIANTLHREGFKVFGSSRRPGKLVEEVPFNIVELDVTNQQSINDCINTIVNKEGTIDILINNAGYAHMGFTEETSEEEAKKQFDTNFWGYVRMCKYVLPFMRKNNSGTIIQITSLAGSIGVPMQSFYSASKHAVDGYTKSLRMELKKFGITAVLVKPGFVSSGLEDSFMHSKKTNEAYNELREKVYFEIEKSIRNGFSPDKVAKTVSKIIQKKNPSIYYSVGIQATYLPKLFSLFPNLFEYGSMKKFKLN